MRQGKIVEMEAKAKADAERLESMVNNLAYNIQGYQEDKPEDNVETPREEREAREEAAREAEAMHQAKLEEAAKKKAMEEAAAKAAAEQADAAMREEEARKEAEAAAHEAAEAAQIAAQDARRKSQTDVEAAKRAIALEAAAKKAAEAEAKMHAESERARLAAEEAQRVAAEAEVLHQATMKLGEYTRKNEAAYRRWKWAVRQILLKKTLNKLSVASMRVPSHMSVGNRLEGLDNAVGSLQVCTIGSLL